MDEILTAGEVAELLQIHPRTVYKLVKEGSIPGRKFGGGWRFSRNGYCRDGIAPRVIRLPRKAAHRRTLVFPDRLSTCDALARSQ